MRWLRIARTRKVAEPERGGISVITALLMVVLLAFAALAIDVGVLYSERAQLQSGADAAAIGIAQKCAENEEDDDCSEITSGSSLAKILADANALDNVSNVSNVELNEDAGKVTVTTGAEDIDGAHKVSLFFANIFGMADAEVGAQASAAWGSPIAGVTSFPLTFSVCQWQDQLDEDLQILVTHGKKAGSTCDYGSSGSVVPGNFGWLDQTDGCGAQVNLKNPRTGGNPGNNPPAGCDDILNSWIAAYNAGEPAIGLFPIFDEVTGKGENTKFNVIGFAAFEIHGWKFKGGTDAPLNFNTTSLPKDCTDSCRGVIGKFVKMVSLDSDFEIGPPDDFGISIVRLTA
ncbi:pilus assembly protein TadG-related protein [Arthrobacter roseus]|uniref:pilus assembly protein TadG-related protein n=1 Tax=Arthrobacter roseus TaxID=136274 RepID=UPI00196387BB|nr:Tad domain-containing protein [Arthrobacter roseus]MBM7849293.1 hypothetical protein [Arthrobacter roseus]